MYKLITIIILSHLLVGCQTEPDDVLIEIPIVMAPAITSEGAYKIKVTVSGPDMTAIRKIIPLSVVLGESQTQIISIPSVPVGDQRKIKVEIIQNDKSVGEQSKIFNLRPNDVGRLEFDFKSLELSIPKITSEKDGQEMVLIPAGSFEMGDHLDGMSNAQVHTVTLGAFYMDTHEVTVGQFKQFVNQSGYRYDGWNLVAKYSPGDDYPMILVTWDHAAAYANWSGKRLPTEAEWEYAARGGLIGRRYPWGDEIDKTKAHYDSWNGGNGTTKPVGSYPANGYGLYDMAGNVIEWCQDLYDFNYYTNSPVNNPLGPGTGSSRVLWGGSWTKNTSKLRVASRSHVTPNNRFLNHGFRCASGLKKIG